MSELMVVVRNVEKPDVVDWSRMRTLLWPDTPDAHLTEIGAFFDGTSTDIVKVLVASVDAIVVGFIELNIRNFAEGSREPKVPYVEGWYVEPDYQHCGIGRRLMQEAEIWARTEGYSELASDAEIENDRSIELHKQLGFKETERVVCFLKSL